MESSRNIVAQVETSFDNACLACGTMCVGMCLWCLYKTSTGDPGFLMRGYNREGIKKHCQICQSSKPDRTHHCSKCQRCVLNMDHHCVWTNNCIGLYNRKSFNLILFWGCMGMICASAIAFYNLPKIYTPVVEMKYDTTIQYLRRLFTMIIILSQTMNSIGLFYFFWKNLRLILKNTTTLDDMRPQNVSEFDLGWKYNFRFYFGKNPVYWILPIGNPLGNGIDWDRKHSEDLIII